MLYRKEPVKEWLGIIDRKPVPLLAEKNQTQRSKKFKISDSSHCLRLDLVSAHPFGRC